MTEPLSKPCIDILAKLRTQKCIGGKHLPEELCIKSIKHYGKEEYRKGIKDLEECIHQGLILIKPKPGTRHFSLNPKKLSEIHQLIQGGTP